MALIAKVVNHGTLPYKEKWNGEILTILPGQNVEMEHLEAVRFVGTYAPEVLDGNGDLISGKTLHLEMDQDPYASKDDRSFVSQIDGEDYGSEAELKAHYAKYKHLQLVRDVSEDIQSKTPLSTGKVTKVYACDDCDFETTNRAALLGHKRSHDAKSGA